MSCPTRSPRAAALIGTSTSLNAAARTASLSTAGAGAGGSTTMWLVESARSRSSATVPGESGVAEAAEASAAQQVKGGLSVGRALVDDEDEDKDAPSAEMMKEPAATFMAT